MSTASKIALSLLAAALLLAAFDYVSGGSLRALIVAADGARQGGRPPPAVELVTVETRSIEEEISATGTLIGPEEVTVATELPGRVAEVRFNEGDAVAKGDVLIALERRREEARVDEARTRVVEAEREFARQKSLYENGNAPESRVDEARTALAEARAALDVAKENLDDQTVEAPFAGVTGRRLISPGAYLEAGAPVTTLVKVNPIDLLFEVPGNQLGRLRNGMAVRARTPAFPDEVFAGAVTFVGTEVDVETRSLPLEATLANEAGRLKPGMFMSVALVIDERKAVTIPEAALISRGPADYVYVVDEENVADRIPVTTGLRKRGWIEIASGLEPGRRLVVSGLQSVRDGAKVTPAQEGGKGLPDDAGTETAGDTGAPASGSSQ